MVKPLSPQEVKNKQLREIPAFVIQAVNELITKRLNGSTAIIHQEELVTRIINLAPSSMALERRQIFDRHMLEFEPLFEDCGWKVEYDKRGINGAYFTFKAI